MQHAERTKASAQNQKQFARLSRCLVGAQGRNRTTDTMIFSHRICAAGSLSRYRKFLQAAFQPGPCLDPPPGGGACPYTPVGAPPPCTRKVFSLRSRTPASKLLPQQRHLEAKILMSEIHESLQRVAGAPEGIRTPDPQIRSLVLYPAELRAHYRIVTSK